MGSILTPFRQALASNVDGQQTPSIPFIFVSPIGLAEPSVIAMHHILPLRML